MELVFYPKIPHHNSLNMRTPIDCKCFHMVDCLTQDIYIFFPTDKRRDYDILRILPVTILEWFLNFCGSNNEFGFLHGQIPNLTLRESAW